MISNELLEDPLTRDIVKAFVGKMSTKLENMRIELEEERLNNLKSLAHELKGTAANFGFSDLSFIASEIETHSHEMSKEQVLGYLNRAELCAAGARREVENS